MTTFRTVLLAALAFGFSGCESMADATTAMREKIAERSEPKTKTVSGSPRLVYEAVRAATTQMGYRFVRGGPAQGEFDAVSGIGQTEIGRNPRQLSMKVRLHGTLDGKGTDVSVSITEIIEADPSGRAGQATETPLRDTPQYDVFFRRVENALAAAKAEPAPGQSAALEGVK